MMSVTVIYILKTIKKTVGLNALGFSIALVLCWYIPVDVLFNFISMCYYEIKRFKQVL